MHMYTQKVEVMPTYKSVYMDLHIFSFRDIIFDFYIYLSIYLLFC